MAITDLDLDSPMVDFGYDISDFYGIQPEYGTMEDFREMIAEANELGLKIILDFVPNHSSTENEWFKKSVKRERGYEDYYVWHDGKLDENGKRIPPSNWLSGFRGSAWEWNEERQQYYLHQFAVQQADLNYRSPLVVEQMKRVLRYWLDQGVAGFRVDALTLLFEVDTDENGQYPDEEVSGLTDDKDDKNYLKMDLIENRPESIDMVYQWHQVMESYRKEYGGDTRVLLIETYAPPDYSMQMYGNATTEGAELPFNFNLITEIAKSGMSAKSIESGVNNWLSNMPKARTANWVIGNHDQRRASSRYGKRNIDAMNMLVMMLPGASITYQGEELGMLDGDISWEDTVDPAACNANPDIYQQTTRDPARTPFQWSSDKNGGFSTASSTWLPMAPDYESINVASETAASNSHLKIYKSLVELRKSSKTLQQGSYKYQALNDNVFVLKRFLAGEETLIYVANFGEQTTSANVLANFDNSLPGSMSVKIVSLDSSKTVNAALSTTTISLAAGEAVILAAK